MECSAGPDDDMTSILRGLPSQVSVMALDTWRLAGLNG